MPEPLEDMDRILEAQEFAYKRQPPLPPSLLELNDRLQASIARQAKRLVEEYRFEHDERQL